MKETTKGIIFVLISTFGFSIVPVLATLGISADIAASTLLFYRFLIASVLFFAFCGLKGKSFRLGAKKNYVYAGISGLIYAAQCILFFSAFQFISAPMGEIIFYINPVFVAILAAIFLKEQITKYKVCGIAAAFCGIGIVLYAPDSGAEIEGVVLVILAAMASACYFIFNKKFTSGMETAVLMGYICAVCCVSSLIYSVGTGQFEASLSHSLWINAGILAVWSTVIGLFCLMRALTFLDAGLVSVISLCEPIFTILLSYAVLGSALSPVQLAGAAIVIAAIYLYEKGPGLVRKK